MSAFLRGAPPALLLFLFLALALLSPISVHAAFINFDNCLDTSIVHSNPLRLQFTPLWFDARFDPTTPSHNLNVTIYGNVSGQQVEGRYPPPDDPAWSDPDNTFGKIVDVGTGNNYSTLLADFKVLKYDAYNARATRFCSSLVNGTCPLGPAFGANASVPYDLSAITLAHDFGSPYSFSTLDGTVRVLSGDTGGGDLACISANITPYLGDGVSALLTWLPAAILILKGIATLSAAIWSPWGSSDIFRWSSNYGRDEDQLRLVTPGFGDCLQYIQFVTLTGALSLQYPGYYQPAVSQTAWSLLLFNQSYVTQGSGTQSLQDGVYAYNGTYGMTAMSQLVGMTSVVDVWACMAIWLLVIAGIVVLLCQLGFFSRWIYRVVTDTTEEDLRSKNLPFTLGNMIRLLFNYFILPIVALSLFQLVIAPESRTSIVVCAVILFVIMIVAGGWILRVIFTTKPRTHLFDDMPTVLLYGPLYNTYSDSAAPFALVPVFITFMRAVALGAVQPSGIAQIIVLAVCEVILILTLNGFRPFQNQTSMNAYHTFFAVVRLITVLLSIAFVPSLSVSQAPKGWIGYAILLLHACVLVFGFFLNAAQTLIEVIARSMGVAGDAQTGAIRGSILNMRMLKKRRNRTNSADRRSLASNAAILQDADGRSAFASRRSRSMSASSQQLLNQTGTFGTASSGNRMSVFDNLSNTSGDYVGSPNADGDNAQGGFGYITAYDPGALQGKDVERAETFYRPPRPRKATNEMMNPGTRTRKSVASPDIPYIDSPRQSAHARESSYDEAYFPGRESPAPAYIRDRADSNENTPRPDYAVREVDQYYRGPALSGQPTRKLKTGPADPEGPAANAQSWFQRFVVGMKGKQKEPSKGFEVVRSSRLPRGMQQEGGDEVEMQTSPPMHDEPYQDSPRHSPPMAREDMQAAAGAEGLGPVSPIEPDDGHPHQHFGFGYDDARDVPAGVGVMQHGLRPSHDSGSGSIHPALRDGPSSEVPRHQSIDGDQSTFRPSRDTESQLRPSQDTYPRPPSSSEYYPNPTTYRNSEVPSLNPIESVGNIDLPSRFNSRRSANLADIDIGETVGGQAWLRQVDNSSSRYRNSDVPSLDPIEGVGDIDLPSRFNSRRSANLDFGDTDGGEGQQQAPWLRDVDNLDWNHHPDQQQQQQPPSTSHAPGLPRRSSRRTPSQDISPRPSQQQQQGEILFDNFDYGGRQHVEQEGDCLLYTSPSPRDRTRSRMPSSA